MPLYDGRDYCCALPRTGLWSPSCFSLRASALARKTTAAIVVCAPAHPAMVAVLFLAAGLCPCSKDDGRDCCVRSRAPAYGRRLVSRCGPLPLLERRRPRLLLCAPAHRAMVAVLFLATGLCPCSKDDGRDCCVRSRAPAYGRRLVSRCGPLPLLERRRPRCAPVV